MIWQDANCTIPVDLVLYTLCLFSQAQIADTQGLENNPFLTFVFIKDMIRNETLR